MMNLVFKDYTHWRTTMTEVAGLSLDAGYCKERIEALSNESDSSTQAFIKEYGSSYRDQVVNWFEQALAE